MEDVNLSKDYIELLRQAYKKLKSSIYFDKTQLILRDKIVRWETDGNPDKKIEILAKKLENINFDSKELRKKLEKLDQDIQKTDFEISKLNSIEFEI